MNTIDELVQRGTSRVQHTSWNEGEYIKITIIDGGMGKRPAPNAMQFRKGFAPDQVPLYTLVGDGEAEWRPYFGPKDAADTEV